MVRDLASKLEGMTTSQIKAEKHLLQHRAQQQRDSASTSDHDLGSHSEDAEDVLHLDGHTEPPVKTKSRYS